MNDATQFFNTSGGGYEISRSLRFNSADSAYLSRTPASAGNRKTWTWAGWVKRSTQNTANNEFLFESRFGSSDSTIFSLGFANGGFGTTKDALVIFRYSFYSLITTQLFRDTSAWYHIVLNVDTTQATASDRIRLYVNGVRITAFSSATYPALNEDLPINTTNAHIVGGQSYFNGYLADVHFIDGQALDPTSFGEFDTNNVWQPKAYSGTYGTNGFHLDFADNSSAAALGYDAAGSNDWTVNNLSVTAGVGNDSLVDSPTNYGTDTGAGNEVRGNYCTMNPLANGGNTLSDGNLRVVGASDKTTLSTIGMSSGKWYCEATVTAVGTSFNVGIARGNAEIAGTGDWLGNDANGWSYGNNGQKFTSNSGSAYGSSFTTGDLIGIAFDADNGTLTFYKNNVSQGTAFSGLTSGPYFFGIGSASPTADFNFGQRQWAYAAPAGFKALCTQHLPTPTITKPSTVMDVVTYTGTGSTLTPTSTLGFSPDLVWIKSRSAATDHALYDAVRGAQARLESNTNDTEATSDNGLTAFNSNGFTLGTLAQVNTNAATYAGWCWDAGSSTVTNTAGSITSQVRANPSAGFSIVTWTGTGADATIGHGLGVTPGLIIVKNRTQVRSWRVWHSAFGVNDYITLDTTAAKGTLSTVFQSQSSTTFGVGSNDSVNSVTSNIVAYCFAPVAGYSSFGSYVGNGSADGPFVFCNFRPTFVMLKYSSGAGGNWVIYDNKRGAINLNSKKLAPNLAGLENDGSTLGDDSVGIDFLSNGFKIRTTGLNHNVSAGTYIYAAFAESPFALARAR